MFYLIVFVFYGNLLDDFSLTPRKIVLECIVREPNIENSWGIGARTSAAWDELFNMISTIDPKTHQTCGGDSGGNLIFYHISNRC